MITKELPTIEEKVILIEFLAILKEHGACTERYMNIISAYYYDGLKEVKETFTKENILDFIFQVLTLSEDISTKGDKRLCLLLNLQND